MGAPRPSLKFTKNELAWIEDFQSRAGAKVDGLIGRETLYYLKMIVEAYAGPAPKPSSPAWFVIGGAIGFVLGALAFLTV